MVNGMYKIIEVIMSLFEIILMYEIIAVIDSKNKLNIFRIFISATTAGVLASIVDYFDLPFYLFFAMVINIFIFYITTKNKLLNVFSDISLATIIIGILKFPIIIVAVDINLNNNCFLIIIYTVFILIFYLLTNVKSLDMFIYTTYRKNRKVYILIILNIVVVYILFSNMLDASQYRFWENSTNLLLIIISYLLVNILLIISFFSIKFEKQKKQYYYDHSNDLQRMVDELAHNEHEYKNHLNMILALNNQNEKGSCKNIEKYISDIVNKSEIRDISNWKDDSILETAMNYNKNNASNYDVVLNYSFKDSTIKYKISQSETIEILSNLINNAIEATKELPETMRYINVHFYKNGIEVINSIKKTFSEKEINNFLRDKYSTKGSNRGFGLNNVKRIIEYHNMTMEVKSKDRKFIVRVNFETKNTKE